MPEKKPVKGGKKGKGLSKKYGPFPAYVYLAIGVALVLFYFYHRRKSQAGSPADQVAGSLNQQTVPSGVVVPPSSAPTDQVNPNGGSDASTTMPTDYVTNTDLQSGLDNLDNQVAAQIAAITFPQPNVNITVPPATVATQTAATKTAAKKSAAGTTHKTPIRYYTKKSQVHLRAGQKLHFTKGKGYYAA